MLTESKQRLRINDWEEHKDNRGGINGEARCFVCMKEQSDDNSSIVPDFISLFLNSPAMKDDKSAENLPTITLKKKDKDRKAKHAAAFHIENIIQEIADYKPGNLISPCTCEKVVHVSCLIRYCLMNICFQCKTCKSYYSVEFQEYKAKSKGKLCAICFSLMMLIIVHTGLLALGVIFVGCWIEIDDKYQFWNYIVGGCLFLIDLGLLFVSMSCLSRGCEKYNKKFPIFGNQAKGSQQHDEYFNVAGQSTFGKKIEMLKDMSNYIHYAHNSDNMDLIERKQNNMIFLETIIQDEMRVMHFIKENNNSVFSLGKDMAKKLKKQLKDDDLENKFPGTVGIIQANNAEQDKHLLRKQKTFTMKEEKSGVEKNQLLFVKSKTRNSASKKMTDHTNKEEKSENSMFPPRMNTKKKSEKAKERTGIVVNVNEENDKKEDPHIVLVPEEKLIAQKQEMKRITSIKEEDLKKFQGEAVIKPIEDFTDFEKLKTAQTPLKTISVEKAVMSNPKYKVKSKLEIPIENESNKMARNSSNCYNCDVIIDEGNKEKSSKV